MPLADQPTVIGDGSFCPGCRSEVAPRQGACTECGFLRPEHDWPKDNFLGRVIKGKYRLEKRLGAGGFGLVFLARQIQGNIDLGHVVVKFLHADMLANEEVRRRFINEAQAARRVRSPHVVTVFDFDFDENGMPFMAMEYIEGQSLTALLTAERRLRPAQSLDIALQTAEALDECHRNEIIHRDLKPDNLLLLDRQAVFIKVIDFGIARTPGKAGTLTQSLIGTPRYMSPEQIMQEPIDSGVDIFALGVILYECLAGHPPIKVTTAMEYLHANVNVVPDPLHEVCPDLPAALDALVNSMLAKRREDRPATMGDVAAQLRAIAGSQRWLSEAVGSGAVDPTSETVLATGPPFAGHVSERLGKPSSSGGLNTGAIALTRLGVEPPVVGAGSSAGVSAGDSISDSVPRSRLGLRVLVAAVVLALAGTAFFLFKGVAEERGDPKGSAPPPAPALKTAPTASIAKPTSAVSPSKPPPVASARPADKPAAAPASQPKQKPSEALTADTTRAARAVKKAPKNHPPRRPPSRPKRRRPRKKAWGEVGGGL